MRKNRPIKAPESLPETQQLQPWREVKQPKPGTLYAVYSPYSDEWDQCQSEPWNAKHCDNYDLAVYRCPDLGTVRGVADYKKLCEVRRNRGWLGMVFDKDYLGNMYHFDFYPRTVIQVFSGELVFFIDGDELFHRVLKDEEVVLLDTRVFQLLLPVDN